MIDEHKSCTIVLALARSFYFDVNLEEFVWPYIFCNMDTRFIQLLISSYHDELDTEGDFEGACILEGPRVLNLISRLEYAVLLERHVLEFGIIL